MARSRSFRLARFLLIAVLLTSLAAGASSEAADTPDPEPAAEAAAEAAATPAEEEPIVINCNAQELLEPLDSWSVDCVAQWLENLGFAELKAAFIGNQIGGPQLGEMTQSKLSEEYGVSDEDSRKKIVYALKDVVRKDNYKGNTNNWAQFFMWILPFLAIYKWLSMRYEKQIQRMTKKYRKWQEARKPVEPEVVQPADNSNDWISGIN